MNVQCPSCLKQYRLPSDQDKLLRVRCRSCGHEFLVSPSREMSHEIEGNGKRVSAVVADIQRDFRNLIIDTLTRQHFHLYVVEDGRKAYEIVVSTKPELLLVNPYLPGLMGTDLITRLRAEQNAPQTIVLLGAIHDARRYRRRPESLYGADDYLDEGIDEGSMVKKLEFHLRQPLASEALGPEREHDAMRMARSVFTDLIVYHPHKMARVKNAEDFFLVFSDETTEARRYLDDKKAGAGDLLREVVDRYLERS